MDGTLKCISGEMPLSRHLHDRLFSTLRRSNTTVSAERTPSAVKMESRRQIQEQSDD